MITREAIIEAAVRHHTNDSTIAREYIQHMFLKSFYALPKSEHVLFKGGTALRIVFESPRFSEDLDYSAFTISRDEIENLFVSTLSELERSNIRVDLHEKSGGTSGGYYGEARLQLYEHTIAFSINIIIREKETLHKGEYKLIHADFVPNYGLLMLPQEILVREKIQALITRAKPRDYYDLYFMLRSGMIQANDRPLLANILVQIEESDLDFKKELSVFLPTDHQSIIRDFKSTLIGEIKRNAGV
jgi:predicted nucleotidyltransferase component of viral defense system